MYILFFKHKYIQSIYSQEKGKPSRSDKGKEVMQELTEENQNRKRKSESPNHLIVENNTDVYEEYFQNGRIYQDWEDLCWTGEPSNTNLDDDLVGRGDLIRDGNNHNSNQLSSTHYQTSLISESSNRLWGGEAGTMWGGYNVNYNPVPSSHFQTRLLREPSNRFGDGGVLWAGEAGTSNVNLHSQHELSNSFINLLTNPKSANGYHLDDF